MADHRRQPRRCVCVLGRLGRRLLDLRQVDVLRQGLPVVVGGHEAMPLEDTPRQHLHLQIHVEGANDIGVREAADEQCEAVPPVRQVLRSKSVQEHVTILPVQLHGLEDDHERVLEREEEEFVP